MKKVSFVVVLFFVIVVTLSVYAETQNVIVSGSLRTRFYWEDNLGDLTDKGGGAVSSTADDGTVTTTYVQDDAQNWVENLVDVNVDAELLDDVYARINFEVFGTFGDSSSWDTYVQEAWIKLANIGGSPVSAIIGSMYLNLGRGFVFSNNDGWYIFDGVCIVGDYMPVVIKGAWIRIADEGKDDLDALFLDIDWSNADTGFTLGGTVLTFADGPGDYQPIVLDGRLIYAPNDSLSVFGEVVYETGDSTAGLDKKAWAAEVGGQFTADVMWTPTIRAMYTYASGDADATDTDDENYDPFFNYTFYGYAFSPALSNIQIINVGIDLQPREFTKLFADFYYYTQVEEAAMVMGMTDSSNPGVTAMTNGANDELGSELDVGVEHTYADSVTTSLIVSYFQPGDAYGDDADDALEIRGEILVSF